MNEHGLGADKKKANRPLNLRKKLVRLAERRNIFAERLLDSWNHMTSAVKNVNTVKSFKCSYKKTQSRIGTSLIM